MTQPLMFKLDQNAKGRGLRCDRDGLFFAGIALLERDAEDQFRSIPATTIRKALSGAYRADGNWESRIRSVDVVAKALNNGDVARAMMAAVLMRLPEPDSGIRIAGVDGVLAKAGFDPDEPRDERGRWTEGEGGEAEPQPKKAGGKTRNPRKASTTSRLASGLGPEATALAAKSRTLFKDLHALYKKTGMWFWEPTVAGL
jgi:hypothetical protein